MKDALIREGAIVWDSATWRYLTGIHPRMTKSWKVTGRLSYRCPNGHWNKVYDVKING